MRAAVELGGVSIGWLALFRRGEVHSCCLRGGRRCKTLLVPGERQHYCSQHPIARNGDAVPFSAAKMVGRKNIHHEVHALCALRTVPAQAAVPPAAATPLAHCPSQPRPVSPTIRCRRRYLSMVSIGTMT